MKFILTLCLIAAMDTGLLAQNGYPKAVSILSQQNFYLNGGLRSTFSNGKSRACYEVHLPPNTVEWYYTFTTYPNENGGQPLQLGTQLFRMLGVTGLTLSIVSALTVPVGEAYADVYLCDRTNAGLFMQKADNNGVVVYSDAVSSRQNFKSGCVRVTAPSRGTWYLCIKNPASSTGINVALEVVAVVLE